MPLAKRCCRRHRSAPAALLGSLAAVRQRLVPLLLCGLVAGVATPAAADNPPIDLTVDIGAQRHAISPLIYGVAWGDSASLLALNAPLNRHGGNATSRYNWQLNADNRGFDWFFESLEKSSDVPGEEGDTFIATSRAGGAEPMLTIPMLDWLARLGEVERDEVYRQRLCSFSIEKYDTQQANDWQWFPDCGNGRRPNGTTIDNNDPEDASVQVGPAFQQGWLSHLRATWGPAATGGLRYYLLDNESSIWHATHRDVVKTGATMEDIRGRIVNLGTRIRQTDPGAIIVGPEEWGWSGFLLSGYDQQYGALHGWHLHPDRDAHGGEDYMPWLLGELRQHELATGVRLLDVFALHYYPQGGEYAPWDEDLSEEMQERRNRSTRSLWDPAYVDESWIGTQVRLLPRMRQWRDAEYPGLGLGITEYNWGAEGHMNGATAQADLLGIFGREGLDLATRWTTPEAGSPAFRAMQMYRNYDGDLSTFGDASVAVGGEDPDRFAAFAAQRSSDGALTVIAVAKSLTENTPLTLDLGDFSAAGEVEVWRLSAADDEIVRLADLTLVGNVLTTSVPAQSVTLFVAPLAGHGCSSISISPATLPDGRVGMAYGQAMSASGGSGGLTLAFETPLPGGLGFAANQLSGTPNAAGDYRLRFAAEDGRGCRRERVYRLVVAPAAGLAPVGLTVDGAGNGVLDFPEEAPLVPTWRNLSGAAVAFTGDLTAFNGPAGPGYSRPDSTADYGTVPAGQNANAASGYAVAVSGARPAGHLDAVAAEALSAGAAKSWTVHLGSSFSDVASGHAAYRAIETLYHHGVTAGCAAGRFCPEAPVSRRELTRLLLRAKLGGSFTPGPGLGLFDDVAAANPYAAWVEELYDRSAIAGCAGWRACPEDPLRRAELAKHLLVALEGPAYAPPAAAGTFTDVPAGLAPWVEQAVSRGIAAGCTPTRFCATAPVTHAMIATWLVRGFDLRLYEP